MSIRGFSFFALEKLRYFIRLTYDLGYYNSTTYGQWAERINEIGKMCGGWLKQLNAKK